MFWNATMYVHLYEPPMTQIKLKLSFVEACIESAPLSSKISTEVILV
jgi:hypothetical protein